MSRVLKGAQDDRERGSQILAALRIIEDGADITVHIARDLPIPMRGAAILAVLAHPPRQADDQTTLLAYRRVSRFLADIAAEEGAGWSARPQLAAPAHLAIPLDEARRALPGLFSKVDQRLAAAHAIAVQRQAGSLARKDGPRQRARRSVSGAALRTIQDDEALRERLRAGGIGVPKSLPEDVDNFETRVLRESLPVVHIAFAFTQVKDELERYLRNQPLRVRSHHGVDLDGSPGRFIYQGMLGDLLSNPQVQDRMLAKAEGLEALLPTIHKPRVTRIIRIRLTDAETTAPALIPFVPRAASEDGTAASEAPVINVPDDAPDAQVALILLAVLAAPPKHGADQEWAEHLCAFYRVAWHEHLRAEPEFGDVIQPVTPDHLTMDLSRARKLVADSVKKIALRLQAAETLLPALRDIANDLGARPRGGAGAWTLSGKVRRVLAKEQSRRIADPERFGPPTRSKNVTGPRATENFRTRVIEPSRPVIHLAAGFAFALEMLEREVGVAAGSVPPSMGQDGRAARFDWWRLYHHPRFARVALGVAAELENAACTLPAGGPAPTEIVRLRAKTT